MFDEIGEKLKGLSGWIVAIGSGASIISAIVQIYAAIQLPVGGGTAILTALIGSALFVLISFVVACLLYAFGTITNAYMDISSYIRYKKEDVKSTPSNTKYNPKALDESEDTYVPEIDDWLKKSKR